MPNSLNKPKTVAILGAGPVGLAAAAHVLERGMEPVVLEAGPQVGHAVRQWSHVPLFSPWEYAIDKASERLLTAAGWNSPAPDQYPTGGELVSAVSRAAGHAHAAQGPHPHQQHGDQRRPRRLRQDEEQRPRLRALHHPLPERQGPRAAQGRCRDRRHRHLVLAQPGRRRRPAGDRRARGAGPHRLRHARRAGPRARPLCRPHRRRAGRRPFGDRHADRSRAPARTRRRGPRSIWLLRGDKPEKAFGGGANDKLAGARRAGRGLRQAGRWTARSASRPASASRTSPATATSCASAPARPAAAASSPSTS